VETSADFSIGNQALTSIATIHPCYLSVLIAGHIQTTCQHTCEKSGLEYCEAQILGDLDVSQVKLLDVFTPDIDLFAGFTVDQINSIRSFFTRETYEKGDLLMREGAAGDSLVLLESGLVDITISLAGAERKRRVSSLSSGTFVCETALLDGKPRSANIEVIQDVTCYVLGVSDFEEIKHVYPDIVYQLLANIYLLFASRLRFSMKMMREG